MATEPLKLKLKIDDTNVKKSAEELKQSFKEMSDSVSGKEVSKKFASLYLQMQKSVQQADELRAKMKALEGTMVETDYGRVKSEIDKVQAKLADLMDRQDKFAQSGKQMPQSLAYNITETSNKLDSLKAKLFELQQSGQTSKVVLGETTDEYAKLEQRLGMVNNKASLQYSEMQQLTQAEQEMATAETDVVEAGTPLEQEMLRMANTFINLRETIGNLIKAGLKRFGESVVFVAKNAIPAMIKGVGKLALKLGGLAKSALVAQKNLLKFYGSKIRDTFKGGSKGVDDVSKSFKRGLTKIFAYGFGIRSLFRLFNKLRGYAKDALNAMSQQFDDVNRDLSLLASKFSKLKNSIGTMVQPIIHALVPALVTLMNVLTNVMTKIGEFFAVLTGQRYIYKATDANIDYAKSLDDNTKKTKKNTKAVKDNQKQLGYYDKLNVIGQDKDKDKTPDTDTGVGANGNQPSGFVKADPTKAVSEFAKKVKEAWKKADFTEVGNIIGKKLQNALNNIPWAGIQKMARKIGKSLGTLINGFVETETGGVSLGTTIGENIAQAFNTAVIGLHSFLKAVRWKSVGKFLTDGINGAIKKIKWKLLGNTIARFVNAGVTLVSSFFNKTDWKLLGTNIVKGIKAFLKKWDLKEVGSAISGALMVLPKFLTGAIKEIKWDNAWANFKTKMSEFFKGIKWKEIFSSFGEAVGSITKALYEVVKDMWADIKAYFDPYIEDAGDDIVKGVLNGIKDAIKNVGKWLKTNVVDPFIKAFKKAFGIASPSKLMIPIGEYIIQGLLDGIKNAWKAVKTFIKNIPTIIKNIFTGANLKSFFSGVFSGIKSVFSNIGGWFGTKFSNAVDKIKSAFNIENIKSFFSKVWSGIKSVFSNVATFFKTTFEDAWKNVKTVFKEGGKIFEGIKKGVVNAFKSIVQSLIDGINAVIKEPFEAINDLLNDLRDAGVGKLKPFKGLWGKDPLPIPQIPALAQGAVIPPNKEFLAMLGDQKQGVNIETPLDTMIQAFRTALGEQGGTANQGDIVVQINGREIARAVRDENSKQYKQTGAFMPRYS